MVANETIKQVVRRRVRNVAVDTQVYGCVHSGNDIFFYPNLYMKYLIIVISAFIIEVASTFYITTVADKSIWMLFFAFVGPFLGLPFIGYIVESKTWLERLKMAFASGTGYVLGAMLVYLFSIWNQ
jgi:hypothetical protein